MLPVQRIELTRNFTFDETQLLAKDREEQILRDAIARAKRSVALTSSCVLPGSSAEWPASGTTRKSASGQARCRSQAVIIGQTTS